MAKLLVWLFLWYIKISSLPKLYYRLSKRSGVTVHQCRALEDAGKKLVKRSLDVAYWERCVDLELCPNFLKFRPPRLRQYKNVKHVYQEVVKESLIIAKDDYKHAEELFQRRKNEITSHLSYMEEATLLSLLNKRYRITTKSILKTHNDKLMRLWKTQKPKCPNCIINLSEKQLSLDEENVLYRGLARNIMHKKVPIDDIKTAVEDCINTVVVQKACKEFVDLPRSNSKSEERDMKAALHERVGDIAKTMCDVTFRDKLKGVFNKFIASAKSLCNSRVNRAFHATIGRLTNDDYVKICKYDKGEGVVLLNTDDYYTKLDVIVNDATKFKKVEIVAGEKHPLTKKENSIKDYVNRYFKKHVDPKTYNKLRPCGSNPGKLYGMCKVHKGGYPMRPVVSMIGTAEYHLAKYLDAWIKPYMPSTYMLNSTHEFLTKINEVPIEHGDYCVSFDVKSLFTNIPLEETIKIIAQYIFANKNSVIIPMSKLIFTRLLRLATQGMFIYRDIMYQQIDGVTMGNCLGPTFANFFLGHLEETVLFKTKKVFHPKFYARYVDDVYCVFQSHVDYMCFMNVLNSLHPNLTFTVEVGKNQLPFLDVQVELLNTQINTWVYRKETNTNVIMNFKDVTPQSWKTGLIFCFLNRAFNLCSSSYLFQREVKKLKSIFLQNAYTPSFFDSVYDKFMRKKEEDAVEEEEETEEETKFLLKLPFVGKCSSDFVKNFRSLMSDTFDVKIKAVYTSLKLQSFFPLKSPTPLPFLSSVVYRYNCVSDPGLFYVGQTSRHLAERAEEHLTFTDKNSAVGNHISNCLSCQNAELSVSNFSVLKKCRTKFETKIFEALFIQKLHPTLNTQVSNDNGFLLKIFR